MESPVLEVGFCFVTYTHLYGFHVIYPCIIAHEPPYQTYSSVGQAGFRRCFPHANDRTRFHVSVGLAQARPNYCKPVYISS